MRQDLQTSFAGILPGKHSSEPFRERIARYHHAGIPGALMAKMYQMGAATVERIYAHFTACKASERISLQCPLVLGIDEHTLHKKQRFSTTLCDLRNNRVFDVLPGKSAKELDSHFARLQGRERGRIVCIDLSQSYRSLVEKWFSNARIVADRFHVVRIMLHHFIVLCREIMGDYKGRNKVCALLRTNPENLTIALPVSVLTPARLPAPPAPCHSRQSSSPDPLLAAIRSNLAQDVLRKPNSRFHQSK